MSTLDLGKIKLVWRGAYDNSTAYTKDDVVSSGGTSYICILASTGNAVTNTTYWNVLAQGGTDVGTTLTTQGDILYRDGSGLQRLAKGTAAQALLMNSGATAPEWGTISSDFVKLAETQISSQVDTVSFDGLFSSDYKVYKLVWTNIIPEVDNRVFKMRYRVSNAQITSGNYWYVFNGGYADNTNFNQDSHADTTDTAIRLNWHGVDNGATGGGANGYGYLHNPQSTDHQKWFQANTIDGLNNNAYVAGWNIWAKNTNNTNALSGVSFFMESGGMTSGNFYLYGMK